MLYLLKSTVNPYQYNLWGGVRAGFYDRWGNWVELGYGLNGLYQEDMNAIYNWTYIPPPVDAFCLYAMYSYYYWPSWEVKCLVFNAVDGTFREALPNTVWNWVTGMEMGDLNSVYGIHPSLQSGQWLDTIYRVNWENGQSISDFATAPNLWPGWRSDERAYHALVNYTGNRVFVTTAWHGSLWTLDTHEKLWEVVFPESSPLNVAWESDSYCWLLFPSGLVLKYDWKDFRRIEMLSAIQKPAQGDLGYQIAYDTYRKRLVVFRWKQDLEDGSAQNQIDFYITAPKATILTRPVPVTSVKKGINANFVANLVGDKGEGIAGQLVKSSLIAPWNNGQVLTPDSYTGLNGSVQIGYRGPDVGNVTDELQVQVDIADILGA